ncbi:sterol desaturase family protein [Shimia sp. MIT1388]|uniref:sterol desaturase family protein n=1 Tax=Shimia sp. MIT1388 TaxID=3096992 RepID=UPI003999A237
MQHELLIRLSVFFGLFIVLAGIETLAPRRPLSWSKSRRWMTNWGLSVLNTLTLRALAIALPLLAVGAASDAQSNGWGLFNTLKLPVAIEVILAILILDFAIWLQHLITHKVPLLWRLHRVHHADPDFDVTTAIRFHPVEIALSMGLKIGLIYLLGPAALAVLVFEILLNGTALFNHANIHLPAKLDRLIRLVLVTPDMHRVHHSVHRDEHDSNYGFALSIWDRALGTYIAQPRAGHDKMTIGLEWQDARPTKLSWSLRLPFRAK